MAHAEQAVATSGHREVQLDVIDFNRNAIDFYEARGFAQVGTSTSDECGAPVTLIRMTKPLAGGGS